MKVKVSLIHEHPSLKYFHWLLNVRCNVFLHVPASARGQGKGKKMQISYQILDSSCVTFPKSTLSRSARRIWDAMRFIGQLIESANVKFVLWIFMILWLVGYLHIIDTLWIRYWYAMDTLLINHRCYYYNITIQPNPIAFRSKRPAISFPVYADELMTK